MVSRRSGGTHAESDREDVDRLASRAAGHRRLGCRRADPDLPEASELRGRRVPDRGGGDPGVQPAHLSSYRGSRHIVSTVGPPGSVNAPIFRKPTASYRTRFAGLVDSKYAGAWSASTSSRSA